MNHCPQDPLPSTFTIIKFTLSPPPSVVGGTSVDTNNISTVFDGTFSINLLISGQQRRSLYNVFIEALPAHLQDAVMTSNNSSVKTIVRFFHGGEQVEDPQKMVMTSEVLNQNQINRFYVIAPHLAAVHWNHLVFGNNKNKHHALTKLSIELWLNEIFVYICGGGGGGGVRQLLNFSRSCSVARKLWRKSVTTLSPTIFSTSRRSFVDPDLAMCLRDFPNVTSLDVSFSNITSDALSVLKMLAPRLERLNLSFCSNVTTLANFSHPNLCEIIINRCPQLLRRGHGFSNVARSVPKLNRVLFHYMTDEDFAMAHTSVLITSSSSKITCDRVVNYSVRTVSGRQYMISSMPLSATLLDLHRKLYQRLQIPVDGMILTHPGSGGTVLRNDGQPIITVCGTDALSSSSVVDGCVLILTYDLSKLSVHDRSKISVSN